MRKINVLIVSTIFLLASCGVSSSDGDAPKGGIERVDVLDMRLLSPDQSLFPLSPYFGVCVQNSKFSRTTIRSIMPSPHYATVAEVESKAGALRISVGKFDLLPGTVFKDVSPDGRTKRIQIAVFKGEESVVVSEFDDSGNMVVIDFIENDFDDSSREEVMRLANSVVACHISK